MYKNGQGYIVVFAPGHPVANAHGRALEHRKVWFDHNGPIPEGGLIHHRNGNREDNSPKNLELVLTRSAHAKMHFPNGFNSEPWNRGLRLAWTKCVCAFCGKKFERRFCELQAGIRDGYKATYCSRHCVALDYLALKFRISQEIRSEISRKAALARWAKAKLGALKE